ncbi:MAG: aldehyde dehydrogenase family protein [Candidatus Thiodiazotropha sp.]
MGLDSQIVTKLEALRKRAQEQRTEGWQPRQKKLRALRRALVKRRAALKEAIAEDLGRPAMETDLVEFMPVLSELTCAISNVERWSAPQRTSTPLALFGTTSEIIPQPKGLCLILSPWNYPASLALGPLTSCIAAGNTAVVKPSEYTPATSRYLRDLINDVFDEDVVYLIEGGADTAQGLLGEPFDHIFFTGSPQVGRLVMAAAAKGPTSVTLELGGKSPVVVLKDADIDKAAAKIVWGKFVNAGQTCIAPDYLLAEAPIAEQLKAAIVERVRKVYPQETGDGKRGADFAQIVSPRHTQRQIDLIRDAREKGAKVLIGGANDASQRFVAPTVLDNISGEMLIDQEELFGPILPVHTVSDLDTAIEQINAGPPPLSSYIFTRDKAAANRFIAEAPAGGSCVNHTLVHFGNEKLPFGGIGPSGIGRSHGRAGFEAFSNMRAVMRDRFSPTKYFFPPYSDGKKQLMAKLLRFMGVKS